MNDQNEGLGGSYLLDLETGQRTLVDRTGLSAPAAEVPTSAAPEPPRKPAKPVAE